MKNIDTFKKNLLWSIISLLPVFVFGGFAIYFGLHEKKSNISYEIINEVNVLDVRKPLKDLKISFQEEDIQKENLSLRIFTVRVENNGEVDILQGQYDASEIWGMQVENSRIIEVRLINSNSKYLRAKLKPNIIQEDKIKLNKIIFEKGKFFILEILALHEKNLKPEIIPIGKIAGIEKNVPIKSWEKNEKSFGEKLFYGSALIHLIRFIIYIVILIITSLFIGSILFGFSKLINKRIRKLRKNKIINVFGDKIFEEDNEKSFLYENYIEHGKKFIIWLDEFIMEKNIIVKTIKEYMNVYKNFNMKFPVIENLNFSNLFALDKKEISIYDLSPLAKLFDNDIFTIGENDKLIIKKEFKKTLNGLLRYIEKSKK